MRQGDGKSQDNPERATEMRSPTTGPAAPAGQRPSSTANLPPAPRPPLRPPSVQMPAATAVPRPPSPPAPSTVPSPPSRPSSTAIPAPRAPLPAAPAPAGPPAHPAAPPPSRQVPRPQTVSQPSAAARSATGPTGSRPAAGGGGASIDIEPGQIFAGRYRIEKQVGRGGMGAVYLAEQEPLQRRVAIKILHGTADQVIVARFQREARLIAQLQHPHIVGLIDFGEDEGRLFLVMEFIDGEPLTALLKREGALPPKRACEIALQIAEALAVAHDLHVVHRDVKPDNVMILKTAGGQDFVKMLDFGVAKIRREGDQQNTIETKAGLIVGSLRYISPEQVESGDITPRTDIYSFGCILYEMMTGRRVFDYPSPADCAIAHLTEKPKPPRVGQDPLVGPMVDFVMRCLEKKPANRPADAREALKVLMACREDPARVVGQTPPDEDHTVAIIQGGIDKAQGSRTIEVQPPPASANPPSRTAPRPGESNQTSAGMPDLVLKRPSGAHSFDIVGTTGSAADGDTSTSFSGMRLQSKGPPPATRRTAWWVWFIAALVIGGGATAAVLIVVGKSGVTAPAPVAEPEKAPSDGPTGGGPVQPSESGQADPAGQADAGGTPPDAHAESDGAVTEAADTEPAAGPDPELQIGTRIITTPSGADVLRDKKVVCKTPCVLPWSIDEKPPLVRLALRGHIDIDLQLVRRDHGTEQRFELRPKTP